MACSKEVRIVLLGKTGSGKSSTGNTILKKTQFEVNSTFHPVTRGSDTGNNTVNRSTVCVIDTPGLFDPCMSEEKVKDQIERAIELAFPGVHVFLLVMRLDVKFTEEEKNTVNWIQENFGEEVQNHIIVLFTHGNELNNKTIEQYLYLNPELKGIVLSKGEYHVFENKDNDETQVTELLKKINKLSDLNGNHMYTKEMYETIKKKQSKKKTLWRKCFGIAGVISVFAFCIYKLTRTHKM